jgi:hypothetical protein
MGCAPEKNHSFLLHALSFPGRIPYDVAVLRLVLDTNVVVAGLRSPSGTSAALLRAGGHRHVTLLANVALAFEYEAVCVLPEHREAAGLSEQDVESFSTR